MQQNGPRVLLIEDDATDAHIYRRLLRGAGVADSEIELTDRLDAAVDLCSQQEFDVIVLDLNLPDAFGIDAVQTFTEACPELPLVVLSGNEDETIIEAALGMGAEDYLLKAETSHGTLLLRSLRYAIERKRARDQVRRMEGHLLKAQRLESLEVMAGGVAHDFNNLLVGILGNAGLVLSDLPKDSGLSSLVEEIERSALMAADLTRQMLAYAGKGRFEVNMVDLSRIVQDTRGLLPSSASSHASFRFEVCATPLRVQADETQIQQTLINLVTNSLESLENGRGSISITTGRAYVEEGHEDQLDYNQHLAPGPYAYLEVTDSGKGMDEQTKARLFDPFFSTKFAGRGLGLAACMGIARGHQGAFRLYSEPGQGTSVRLLLPLAEDDQAATPCERDSILIANTILVVDDHAAARTVAQRALVGAGFQVILATDGREALSLYSTHREEIQLVLLDMTMPEMDGDETYQRLLQIDSAVRVVMISGYNEQDVVGRLRRQEPHGFIQKPYRIQDLVSKIQEALQREAAH